MANKLRYQIDELYNIDGTLNTDLEFRKKFLPHIYFIYFLKEGRNATLIAENDMMMKTSKVKDISIWENGIKVTTQNTIYHLNPYMVGENNENIQRLF